MLKAELDQVNEFQNMCGDPARPVGTQMDMLPDKLIAKRQKLCIEELDETISKGLIPGNLVEVADGCADEQYVLLGTALELGRVPNAGRDAAAIKLATQAKSALIAAFQFNTSQVDVALSMTEIIMKGIAAVYGIPFEQVFSEVHRSNMTKVFPDGTIHKNEIGKVMKPDGYSRADIAAILDKNLAV